MPITSLRQPTFKPPRDLTISYDGWKKGLNLFARETEIDKSELDKDIIISQDLLQLGSSDGIIVITLTPEKTIGTYMEIAIAKTLNSSIPVYFVCPSEITRNSIWIKAFSNEIFSRTSDLNRKILQEYSF